MNITDKTIVLGKLDSIHNSMDGLEIHLSYKTKIYNNYKDIQFMSRLERLGFEIISIRSTYVTVQLPMSWLHLKINSEEEVVVDDKHIIRILSRKKDRSSRFCSRASFEFLRKIDEYTERLDSLVMQIYYDGSPVNTQTFHYHEIRDLIGMGLTDEQIVLEYEKAAVEFIRETFPEERLYW